MKTVLRNYFVLILLGFVFAAPGISAYFFYTHPHWLGDAFTNKGVLLSPPVLLTHLDPSKATTVSAKEIRRSSPLRFNIKSKWQLVLWSPTACEKSCIEQLDKLARIRLALGRRLYEVVPLLLLGANAPPLPKDMVNVLQERDIQVVQLPVGASEHTSALKSRLEIFIANPDNYLVLAYLPTARPGDIFHDINQLLNTTDKMSK